MTGAMARSGVRLRGVALTLGIAAAVVLVDQLSKALITSNLGPNGGRVVIDVVPGLLRFIYVENPGAAFGMFQGGGSVLTFLAVGVVLVLAIAFRRLVTQSLWLSVAFGLQFGGALGNIIDRVRLGYVVDFINVPHWPTFNVADSAITVGVVILGFYLLFHPTSDPSDRENREGGPRTPAQRTTIVNGEAVPERPDVGAGAAGGSQPRT